MSECLYISNFQTEAFYLSSDNYTQVAILGSFK